MPLVQPLVADEMAVPFILDKQFSVDQVIILQDGTTINNKLYTDGGNVRAEMNMHGMQIVGIIMPDQQKMYSVMVAQRMTLEMPYNTEKVKQMMPLAAAGDGAKFEPAGSESIDGIACTKYKMTAKDNKVYYMWVDGAKKLPVKLAAADNSFSMLWKNYQPGPQDASLFVPPADFQIVKMPDIPIPGAPVAPPVPAPTPGSDTQ